MPIAVPSSDIFYYGNLNSAKRMAFELLGVLADPEPHVIGRLIPDGEIVVLDLDSCGVIGEPQAVVGWAVVKILKDEVGRLKRHEFWWCTHITRVGFARCQDPASGILYWLPPKMPPGTLRLDREVHISSEGKKKVIALQGFLLQEGPDQYRDAEGVVCYIRHDWDYSKGSPEDFLPRPTASDNSTPVSRKRSGSDIDRRYLPYELAKWYVSSLEMGRTDWEKFLAVRPECIPEYPKHVFLRQWSGWGDWLGLTTRRFRWSGASSVEREFSKICDLSPINRPIYLRHRDELEKARKAMEPLLEYRRKPILDLTNKGGI